MKVGLISDIHGDPFALELAWSYLTVMGADRIICAGDLVGYGPFPDRVVSFLQKHRIEAVRGNHDRWALERGPGAPDEFGGGPPGSETLEYLRALPFDLVVAADPFVAVVVHGSPRSDMEFVTRETHPRKVLRRYLLDLQCELLVVGHTHRPMWFRCADGMVINPGSTVSIHGVESSRSFAMVDLDSFQATFHDVECGAAVEVQPWS
jgi:putative phosphoesterase